jgi:MFS family permease
MITVPLAMLGLAMSKWLIDLYPRDRYGQFGSASAMTSSIGGAMMGPLCGWLFDFVKDYRFVWLWPVFFHFGAAIAAWLVYRKWKSMGGETGYKAP